MILKAWKPLNASRRLASPIVLLALSLTCFAGHGAEAQEHWVGTWATGPAGPAKAATTYTNQTLRLIVHTSIGGSQVRVRISNTFGAEPLVIGAAHIARRKAGAAVEPGTDHALLFSGRPSFTVPAGAFALSDPVELAVAPLSDLSVSIYFPETATANTMHQLALQTNYIAHDAGDFTAAPDLPEAKTSTAWDFLTGVDIAAEGYAGSIVAFGDSITDGANSTVDMNGRWPNVLAARLQGKKDLARLGVLDVGVIGNRVLHPTEAAMGNLFAPAGLARFDRDVLAQAGVKYVIVLLGINDIGHPGSNAPASEEVTAEDIVAGYRQLIARAHEKGLKIYGCTLTPFENTTIPNFYSESKDAKRQAVNQWIRTSGAFDAVIDFDKAVRDPSHPARFLPSFDGGDHLHPSDAGLKAMGDSIDLALFK